VPPMPILRSAIFRRQIPEYCHRLRIFDHTISNLCLMKTVKTVFLQIFFLFFLLSFTVFFRIEAQVLSPTETEAVLNVVVTSMKDVPRQGEKILFVGEKSKKTFSGITDKAGKFSILIPEGDTYSIEYKTFSETVEYNKFEAPSESGKFTYDLDIKYDPPQTFTLQDVLFETGKSILRPESNNALNDMVEIMKLKPGLVIEISGHTDNVGTPESNLKLSLDRANAVKSYMVQHGVTASRMTTKGYGDTQPAASNDTSEGKQKNRRTEVKIIKE
jgi:OmpA-OmpF porin, OOP family